MAQKFIFKGFHPCDDGKEYFILNDKAVRGRFVRGGGVISGSKGEHAYIPVSGQKTKVFVNNAEKTMALEVLDVIPESVEQVKE